MQDFPGQHILVRRHAVGRFALNAVVPRGFDSAEQRRRDRRRDFVLDGENILELAIVALGPEVGLGFAVDQLDRHSDAIRGFAHAALNDVVHAEFPRDLLGFHRLALVNKNRVARDHQQLAEARQFGDDVLGQPVGEKLLLRIAAHIDERQHGDRRFANADLRRRLRDGDAAAGSSA